MKIIFQKTLLLFIFFLLINLFLTLSVQAQQPPNSQPPNVPPAAGANQVGSLENPLGPEDLSPQELYGRLIYGFLGISGTLALVMFIVGGFQWMTASGNPERVKKGRDTLMWAVLGLIVIFASYAILRAILEAFQF